MRTIELKVVKYCMVFMYNYIVYKNKKRISVINIQKLTYSSFNV